MKTERDGPRAPLVPIARAAVVLLALGLGVVAVAQLASGLRTSRVPSAAVRGPLAVLAETPTNSVTTTHGPGIVRIDDRCVTLSIGGDESRLTTLVGVDGRVEWDAPARRVRIGTGDVVTLEHDARVTLRGRHVIDAARAAWAVRPDPQCPARWFLVESIEPRPDPPAWALDLAGQLECEDEPVPVGWERGERPPIGRTGTASPSPWLELLAPDIDLPATGFVIEPQNRWEFAEAAFTRHVYRAGGRIKALILMEGLSRQNESGFWEVTAWRSCAPAEFDAADGRTTDDGPWLDEAGVATDEVRSATGPGHCDHESTVWLRYRDQLYLRDPLGRFATLHAIPFAADTELPAGATDTGLHTTRWRLHVTDDPDAIWIETATGVERWPRSTEPGIGCA